jgi:hypothetical protein
MAITIFSETLYYSYLALLKPKAEVLRLYCDCLFYWLENLKLKAVLFNTLGTEKKMTKRTINTHSVQ